MTSQLERLKRLWRRLVPPRAETSAVGAVVVLAAFVGVAAGVLCLFVAWLVEFLNRWLFFGIGRNPEELAEPWRFGLVCIPPVVFLAVAWTVRRLAPEARGTGIDRVMETIGRGGGFIRKRVMVLKPLATALCLGAGAPLGLEGPVIHTGAAVGSLMGRRAKLGVPNIRILVAAGAAGGLAAKYGAPIGGAVLSAELLLGGAGAPALLPLIVASFAAVIARFAILGHVGEFAIQQLPPFGAWDYVLLALLGIAAGLAATYFIKIIFAIEDFLRELFSQWWARALFGGLAVGLVGYIWPQLLGTGKGIIQSLLEEPEIPFQMLLLFVILKPLLSSVALGSGQSGGVFAPSLFTGAALGILFHGLAAGVTGLDLAPSTAYALVGMAAVMGAVMRAPLQAILITFELTRDFSVIPPLMIGCVVAIKVSELFEPESAFTRRLVRCGARLARGMDIRLLEEFRVSDILDEDFVALPASVEIDQIAVLIRRSENRTFPVVDEQDRLVGIVMLASLVAGARSRGGEDSVTVGELVEPETISLRPDQSVLSAWETMGNYDYDCLPVCPRGEERIVGICEKEAIIELHDRQAFVQMTRESGDRSRIE
jgi:CIC family chloride channel protein